MGLKSLKFSEQAISEIEQLMSLSREQMSDEKNIEKFDEIFPIFKNTSAVICCAVLEFVSLWEEAKVSQSSAKIKQRRRTIIKLLKRVRRKRWLSNEIRGYNLD